MADKVLVDKGKLRKWLMILRAVSNSQTDDLEKYNTAISRIRRTCETLDYQLRKPV